MLLIKKEATIEDIQNIPYNVTYSESCARAILDYYKKQNDIDFNALDIVNKFTEYSSLADAYEMHAVGNTSNEEVKLTKEEMLEAINEQALCIPCDNGKSYLVVELD